MAIELTFTGQRELGRALEVLADISEQEALGALREEAEVEMTEAKRRTPVDTGELRRSGRVVADPRHLAVQMLFGNAAAHYALHVHENLEAFHRVGQAKYLESVLLESAPHLPARVARTMRERIEARWRRRGGR